MYEDSTYVDEIYQQHFLPEANKEQTIRPMARIPTNIITDNVNKNNGGYGGLQYSSELQQRQVLPGPRKNQPNRPIAKRELLGFRTLSIVRILIITRKRTNTTFLFSD
jgi:hypothetical protein